MNLYTIINRGLFFSLGLSLLACASQVDQKPEKFDQDYTVDLNDRSDDTFKVNLKVKGLKAENNIYQFASTAPGTYQVMDMGRYVSDFTALDKKGDTIKTEQVSTNQFLISSPENVQTIQYKIAETWDTPVDKNPIYAMCGTSLENDHVLINGQGVFGYFLGHQSSPLEIKLNYPKDWKVGTALSLGNNNTYYAATYDFLVDSPILLGNLSRASKMVQNTEVEVYTYSKTDLIESDEVLSDMDQMLFAASKFVNGLPVDRYTFLFVFEDVSAGAWEHSYSSEYVFEEGPWDEIRQGVLETAAHEFFHVVTPLNIHSEIIQAFNFVTPVPSEHLWLYEGTTEWASHMMLFQDGLIDTDAYLMMLKDKISTDKSFYDANYSLVDLALNSYTEQGQMQYGNIYMRGALIAGLLDLKLIQLSNGEMSLKTLVNDLALDYGPDKPFSELLFFEEIEKRTDPEIGNFIDDYIKGTKDLPFEEYYEYVGINYQETVIDSSKASLNTSFYPMPNGLYVLGNHGSLKKGDFIVSIDNKQVNKSNYKEAMKSLSTKAIGTQIDLKGYRGQSSLHEQMQLAPNEKKYVFELDDNPSAEQLRLRTIWMGK